MELWPKQTLLIGAKTTQNPHTFNSFPSSDQKDNDTVYTMEMRISNADNCF